MQTPLQNPSFSRKVSTFLLKNPVDRITYPRPLCHRVYGHFVTNGHGHFVTQAYSSESYRFSGSWARAFVENFRFPQYAGPDYYQVKNLP